MERLQRPCNGITEDTALERLYFKKNDVLLKEGDSGDAAYLILSGEVEIRKGHYGQNPRKLATLGKGNVVGELTLFDKKPHMATVIATEDTEVNAMSRDEFEGMVETMSPVMKRIVRMLVTRFRQAVNELIPKPGEVNWADWKK